ncbi:DUF1097 domain-containing protein [uncultured Brevundimonas sp.]|uniref:DUF1097 domain-containing protein n=1 Tax=uncultured Brevundimonas sp. TaxID=213418 RepID=UPI0026079E06|nr:DUF1097 domain-containing protein [uncultured Brevundimonas sp.]
MTHSVSAPPRQPVLAFLAVGGVAALIASAAATSSLALGFLPWAMFVGWVAWYTRPTSLGQGVATWLCLFGGLVFGALAVTALGVLSPSMGTFALSAIVFVVALTVVSMRNVRLVNNTPAWFLGLIAFFASHMEPGVISVVELGATSAIGVGSGWVSMQLQQRLARAH